MPHAGYTIGLGELHMLEHDSRMETLENMQLWLYTMLKHDSRMETLENMQLWLYTLQSCLHTTMHNYSNDQCSGL